MEEKEESFRIVSVKDGKHRFVGKKIFEDKTLLAQMGFMQQDVNAQEVPIQLYNNKEVVFDIKKEIQGEEIPEIEYIQPNIESEVEDNSTTSFDVFNPDQIGDEIPEAEAPKKAGRPAKQK